VGEIEDRQILALIYELEQACPGVGSRLFANSPLLHFLTQCIFPSGTKHVRITTAHVPLAPLLESRVGKLPDGALRDLCGELAKRSGKALEFYGGNKVYVLLNKTLPKDWSVNSPSETQRRWDNVWRNRRSNR
jgi:hypothetical protein